MDTINYSVQTGTPIADALKLIDKEASGLCLVMDGTRIIGMMTDGDARRAFLTGTTLQCPVDLAMKREFFSLPPTASLSEIQKGLRIHKLIPIVNECGQLIDLATKDRYHHIPLVEPVFDGNELEYVTDCITSGWISSQGRYVKKFEESFGDYIGVKQALAVSNGTVALHLALVTLGIGPGDEVIVPDLTFAAPVNAICYVGATPVFVDVDPITMAIDPNLVSKAITHKTKAIVAVHLYGHPVDIAAIMDVAKRHNLKVVEDCAEALGSLYHGTHVGCDGDAATFSFFGNKMITTGEGGMLVIKDPELHSRAQVLRDHGMSPARRYWHEEIGYNYRLTNIQAAIGVAQLQRIDEFVDRKLKIAEIYKQCLSKIPGIQLPGNHGNVRNSYWLYTILLRGSLKNKRNELLELLKLNGIESRPVFYPMHRMPPYQKYCDTGEKFEVADRLSDGGLSLPTSITNSDSEITYVCSLIRDFLQDSA